MMSLHRNRPIIAIIWRIDICSATKPQLKLVVVHESPFLLSDGSRFARLWKLFLFVGLLVAIIILAAVDWLESAHQVIIVSIASELLERKYGIPGYTFPFGSLYVLEMVGARKRYPA